MKISLRKPYFPKSSIDKIQKETKKILLNGQLTLGKNVKNFESKFAEFIGTKYAIAVSSGTAGLHLSLISKNIKKDDEVIVPAKTFISTANAAIYCNAKPIFCDVDEETYQIHPEKLKKLITNKTKAIIPVHLGGNVCPMKEILEIANRNNIPVIEDAAHAHGSTFNEKKAGSFGLMGIFSFYADKVMASSDGGIIVTNNRNLCEKLYALRNVGRKALGRYDFSNIGYNYRMNEFQAILAKEQLRLLPQMLKKRQKIASIYNSELGKLKNLITPKILPNIRSSYYAYILRLTKGNLQKFRTQLEISGIETSPMFITLYKMKPYKKLFGKMKGLCPVSEKLDNQTFTIPLHPGMTNVEVNFVVQTIKRII